MANTKLRIADVCKEKGVTIAALAERLNIKPASMSQAIWAGSFSSARLGEIADALGVTVPELYQDFQSALDAAIARRLAGTWTNADGSKLTISLE